MILVTLSKPLIMTGIRGVVNGPNVDLDHREDSGRISVISPNDQWGFYPRPRIGYNAFLASVLISVTWIVTWDHGTHVEGFSSSVQLYKK